MNTTIIIAAGQVLFGVVGLLTGWITGAEATALIAVGIGVFGIHKSNAALGNKLAGR